MRVSVLIAAAVAAAITALPAMAADQVFNFSVGTKGGWFNLGSTPFGLPAQPILPGTVTIDTTTLAIDGFDWTTGSKTWGLSDVSMADSMVGTLHGQVAGFFIVLGPDPIENYLQANGGGARLDDGNGDVMACNSQCVRATFNVIGTPEPATWTMLLLGFGAIGAAARRRSALERV